VRPFRKVATQFDDILRPCALRLENRENIVEGLFELLVELVWKTTIESIAHLTGKHRQLMIRRHHRQVAIERDRGRDLRWIQLFDWQG